MGQALISLPAQTQRVPYSSRTLRRACLERNPRVGTRKFTLGTNKGRGGTRPCKKRKDGAASAGMAQTNTNQGWATRPGCDQAQVCGEPGSFHLYVGLTAALPHSPVHPSARRGDRRRLQVVAFPGDRVRREAVLKPEEVKKLRVVLQPEEPTPEIERPKADKK
jgi:hypothetical protein